MSEMLESLSGYRHIHPPETPEATHNPVAWSYVRTKVGGQKAYILSRVADAGLDYSGRSNKLAHHVVLEKPDLPDSGPAACLASNKLTIQSWESDARVLPTRDLPNVGQHPSKDMTNWQSLAGDENWCHYLLNELRKKKPVYIIYALGTDVLPLLVEAQASMQAAERWRMTFSTYFTRIPQEVECLVRCVPIGSKEADAVLARHDQPKINLVNPGVAPPVPIKRLPPSSLADSPEATTDQPPDHHSTTEIRLAPPDHQPPSKMTPVIRKGSDNKRTRRRLGLLLLAVAALGMLCGTGYWLLNRLENQEIDNTEQFSSPETAIDTTEPNDTPVSPSSRKPQAVAANEEGSAINQLPPPTERTNENEPRTSAATTTGQVDQLESPAEMPSNEPSLDGSGKSDLKGDVHWVINEPDLNTELMVNKLVEVKVLPPPNDDQFTITSESGCWRVIGTDSDGFPSTTYVEIFVNDENQLSVKPGDGNPCPNLDARTVVVTLEDQRNQLRSVFLHAEAAHNITEPAFYLDESQEWNLDLSTTPLADSIVCEVVIDGKQYPSPHIKNSNGVIEWNIGLSDHNFGLSFTLDVAQQTATVEPHFMYKDTNWQWKEVKTKVEPDYEKLDALEFATNLDAAIKKLKKTSSQEREEAQKSLDLRLTDINGFLDSQKECKFKEHLKKKPLQEAALEYLAGRIKQEPTDFRKQIAKFEQTIKNYQEEWDVVDKARVDAFESTKDFIVSQGLVSLNIKLSKTMKTGGGYTFLEIKTEQ